MRRFDPRPVDFAAFFAALAFTGLPPAFRRTGALAALFFPADLGFPLALEDFTEVDFRLRSDGLFARETFEFFAFLKLPWRPAALPATAPMTPPTTAPTGPATLPMIAPVAAPATCFEIGGMEIFSGDSELWDDLSAAIGGCSKCD